MPYVDGFVVPVPRAQLDAYRAMAEAAGKVWMEHGALQYWECVGDDVPDGEVTSFPMAVKLQPDEVACFSWIVYTSRAERDRINAAVMADRRLADMQPANMSFDAKRMIFGGFTPVVQLGT